jgi:hypothetical protein
MERWLYVEIYPGRSLCQAVEFTEQYVVNLFLPSLFGEQHNPVNFWDCKINAITMAAMAGEATTVSELVNCRRYARSLLYE